MTDDRESLCQALSVAYRVMVASEPLLRFAIERTEDGTLKDYFVKHLEEESGHEAMALADLKALGVEDVPYSQFAALLAGSQYYNIAHDHPAMLLGYMRALEDSPLRESEVSDLVAKHGVELTALRHHVIHDPGHKADLDVMIASLPGPLRSRVLLNETWVRSQIGRTRG